MSQPDIRSYQTNGYYSLLDSIAYSEDGLEIIRLRKLMQDSIKNVQEQIQQSLEAKTDVKIPHAVLAKNLISKSSSPPKLKDSLLAVSQSSRTNTVHRLHTLLKNAKTKKQHEIEKLPKHVCAIPLAPLEQENKRVGNVNDILQITPEKSSSSKVFENVSFVSYKEPRRHNLGIKVLHSIDIEGTFPRLPEDKNSYMELKKINYCDAMAQTTCLEKSKAFSSIATNTEEAPTLNDILRNANVSPCHKIQVVDNGTVDSHELKYSAQEMINKSTQANSLSFSKGVQVNSEDSLFQKAVNISTNGKEGENKDTNSNFISSLDTTGVGNRKKVVCENESEKVQPSLKAQFPELSAELSSSIKQAFESYEKSRKDFLQTDRTPQKERPQSVMTRDVSIQINPPSSFCRETMTDTVKTQNTNIQCGDDFITFPPSPERPRRNFTPEKELAVLRKQTFDKSMMTLPSLTNDIETQVERLLLLHACTQTSEMQSFAHSNNSANNTSVSSATMSDSEFVDDSLSEGEVRLPWNLRLLSALDRNATHLNSMLLTGRSDSSSWENDDYSLSEGEIHPKCLAYYESLFQQKKLLTDNKQEKSLESLPDKLTSMLHNRFADSSLEPVPLLGESSYSSGQLDCSNFFITSNFSDDELSGQSLSPGEVRLKPQNLLTHPNVSTSLTPHSSSSQSQDNDSLLMNVQQVVDPTKSRTENVGHHVSFFDSSIDQSSASDEDVNALSKNNSFRNLSRTPLKTVHEEDSYGS